MDRRRFALSAAATLGGLSALGGCAALNMISVDISTFGDWPAGRAPGRYAFDRLPSQQAQAEMQQRLEDAAAAALAQAGFAPVPAGEQPDVLVQLAARNTRSEPSPWDDPVWWRGGFGYWRGGPWHGPVWGLSMRFPASRSYDREVALLLRDRDSGKPLYEARASSEGFTVLSQDLARALFGAALTDFPRTGPNPRTVRVSVP